MAGGGSGKLPTVTGVPRSHPCRRANTCTGRAPNPAAWCSATCQRIDRSLARLPRLAPVHMMTVRPDVAVTQAPTWLDVRAKGAA